MREEIYAFPEGKEEKPFHVGMAGISYCDGSYKIQRARSGITVLEYVKQGTGTIIMGQKRYNPQKGDIYILPKGRSHHYFSSKDNPWVKIWFNIHGSLAPLLLEQYGLANTYVFSGLGLADFFEQEISQVRALSTGRREAVHPHLAVRFHGLMNQLTACLPQDPQKPIYPTPVADVISFIEKNATKRLSCRSFALASGVSVSQTNRLFRKHLGTTPYDYYLNYRLRLVKDMLKNTCLPLRSIAWNLEFFDEYHLAHFFKTRSGISPGQYRGKAALVRDSGEELS